MTPQDVRTLSSSVMILLNGAHLLLQQERKQPQPDQLKIQMLMGMVAAAESAGESLAKSREIERWAFASNPSNCAAAEEPTEGVASVRSILPRCKL